MFLNKTEITLNWGMIVRSVLLESAPWMNKLLNSKK